MTSPERVANAIATGIANANPYGRTNELTEIGTTAERSSSCLVTRTNTSRCDRRLGAARCASPTPTRPSRERSAAKSPRPEAKSPRPEAWSAVRDGVAA